MRVTSWAAADTSGATWTLTTHKLESSCEWWRPVIHRGGAVHPMTQGCPGAVLPRLLDAVCLGVQRGYLSGGRVKC